MLDLMLEILHDYGYEVPYVGKNMCCLFHEESRASARIFPSGQYHCWSANCGIHFSTPIDAIMQLESCDFKKALAIAQEKYNYKLDSSKNFDLAAFYSIQESIVNHVIKQKPEAFLSVYKTMDELIEDHDIEKLKKLYTKLVSGEIK